MTYYITISNDANEQSLPFELAMNIVAALHNTVMEFPNLDIKIKINSIMEIKNIVSRKKEREQDKIGSD